MNRFWKRTLVCVLLMASFIALLMLFGVGQTASWIAIGVFAAVSTVVIDRVLP